MLKTGSQGNWACIERWSDRGRTWSSVASMWALGSEPKPLFRDSDWRGDRREWFEALVGARNFDPACRRLAVDLFQGPGGTLVKAVSSAVNIGAASGCTL